MRTRYLLCYDVRDERRLRRVGKLAEEFGYRLQYSVFVCDLSQVERSHFQRRLGDILNLSVDAAVLIDLGPADHASARRFQWLSSPPTIPDPLIATIT
ncbi:MAG: CRISPR-associated endonuclease Cas2 [Gaiellaceae bacterium]